VGTRRGRLINDYYETFVRDRVCVCVCVCETCNNTIMLFCVSVILLLLLFLTATRRYVVHGCYDMTNVYIIIFYCETFVIRAYKIYIWCVRLFARGWEEGEMEKRKKKLCTRKRLYELQLCLLCSTSKTTRGYLFFLFLYFSSLFRIFFLVFFLSFVIIFCVLSLARQRWL